MTFHGGRGGGGGYSLKPHTLIFFSLPFWKKLTGTVANHKRDMSPERSGIFYDKKNLQTTCKAPCWWIPWLNRIILKAAVIWQMHGSRLHQGLYNSTLNDMEDPLQVFLYFIFALLYACKQWASNLVHLWKPMLNWKQFWEIRKHPFWRQSQYFKYMLIFFQSIFLSFCHP